MKDLDVKIKLLNKYFKKIKAICLLELKMHNIEDIDLYIGLFYMPKVKLYRIFWFDLTNMINDNPDEWVNSSLIFPQNVEEIKELIAAHGISKDIEITKNYNVELTSYITDYQYNRNTFQFKRYIPKEWDFLAPVLFSIFKFMPHVMNTFYQ